MQEEIITKQHSEVADVLKHTNLDDLMLSVHQQKTLRAVQLCRTAALGGHVDACNDCGNISISYNSCRNRHCPKCQGHKTRRVDTTTGSRSLALYLLSCSVYPTARAQHISLAAAKHGV